LVVLARMKGAASTAPCHPQKITMRPWAAGALAVATLCSGRASGQSAVSAPQIQLTNDGLSKEAENPVSRVISLPLRYEADFLDGPYHATKNTFELDQAVLPFELNDDWALITRTKFPAYSQPPKKLGDSWSAGLGSVRIWILVSAKI
jgi:hypothetical protein